MKLRRRKRWKERVSVFSTSQTISLFNDSQGWFTKLNAIFREVLLFFLKEVGPLKL